MLNDLPKILLIEDDATISKVHTYFLQKLGCEVDAMSTGKSALHALTQQSYTVMILDLDLPDMQGEKILEALREHEHIHNLKRLPVIVTTATTDINRIQRCQMQGANDCLSKPVHFQVFQSTLIKLDVLRQHTSLKTDINPEAFNHVS